MWPGPPATVPRLSCMAQWHGGSDAALFCSRRNRDDAVIHRPRLLNSARWSKVRLAIAGDVIVAVCAGCDGTDSAAGNGHNATPVQSNASPTADPTRTMDPLAQAKIDLRKVQSTYYASYIGAAAKPSSKSAVDRLLNVYESGSPGAKGVAARMKSLARDGFAAKPGPDGYFVVESVTVASVAEDAPARVVVCTYYDGTTYDTRHNGPDGKPVTVNDTAESGRTRFRYVRRAGEWKLVGGDVLKSWTGGNHCPAEK